MKTLHLSLLALAMAGCAVAVTPAPAGPLAARKVTTLTGLADDTNYRGTLLITSEADWRSYHQGLKPDGTLPAVDFATERVVAMDRTFFCEVPTFIEEAGRVTWSVPKGPQGCAFPQGPRYVDVYAIPAGTVPVTGTIAFPGIFPSPSPMPTSSPAGFDFNGSWTEAAPNETAKTVEACGARWMRYAFSDPELDGRDVKLTIDAVAQFVGFGFAHGELVGNKQGDSWVFTGKLTTPGPADGPEEHPYGLTLRPEGRVLVGTSTHETYGEAAVRLAPATPTGLPCPSPSPE